MKKLVAQIAAPSIAMALIIGIVGTAATPATAAVATQQVATTYTTATATQSVQATGSIESGILANRVVLRVPGGKSFNGDGPGLFTPGFGAFAGDIYLDDGVSLDDLYQNTALYQVNAAAVYLNVNFYDSGRRPLGSFHGGGGSTVLGTGGATGSWS